MANKMVVRLEKTFVAIKTQIFVQVCEDEPWHTLATEADIIEQYIQFFSHCLIEKMKNFQLQTNFDSDILFKLEWKRVGP